MTEPTEDSLTEMLERLADQVAAVEDRLAMQPTHLLAPPSMLKQALKVLYYKPPIRRVSGARKRKLALYWR
jgi:phage major head subunit gpT-like protein